MMTSVTSQQGNSRAPGVRIDTAPSAVEALPAGASGASITLEAVTKRYGDQAVVDNVDLRIEPGEFMTFLGPSGSGKTTTLNMIAGFTHATEGVLQISGSPVTKVPPHKRDIGMVFQNYALFPHKTVEENIAYPLQRRRLPREERLSLIQDALAMVKMTDFAKRFPSELSGGQQQRVALARALVYKPQVLLMDEPLGALDKKLRDWLQMEIKRIHREVSSTFVYVTHDQAEALSLSDRIAVFNNGHIEQVGSPVELYARPKTLFVGQFLGESTVLLGEQLQSSGGQTAVRLSGRVVTVPGVLDSGRPAILIRPENLSLSLEEPVAGDRLNSLPVRVTEVTYLGSDWHYRVQLPDGSHGLVRESHDAELIRPGVDAVMSWEADHGVLLPQDDETGSSD